MTADALLGVALGGAGSGRARYAVAMGLFQSGQIGPEVLEAYRVAAGDDATHPAAVLAERHLALPEAAGDARPERPRPD
jgi:hypothetical protein